MKEKSGEGCCSIWSAMLKFAAGVNLSKNQGNAGDSPSIAEGLPGNIYLLRQANGAGLTSNGED